MEKNKKVVNKNKGKGPNYYKGKNNNNSKNKVNNKKKSPVVNSKEEREEVVLNEGRILVRPSGTEPLLRVMVEAKSDELCHKYVYRVIDFVKEKGL